MFVGGTGEECMVAAALRIESKEVQANYLLWRGVSGGGGGLQCYRL